jgi:hypothetical protein
VIAVDAEGINPNYLTLTMCQKIRRRDRWLTGGELLGRLD